MTALNKQAREEKARESFEQWAEQSGALPWGILKKHRNQDGSYPGPHYTYMWHAWNASHEALLDEMEAAEKRIAEQREYYEGVIADGSKRIAELERSETQLINERDSAESALNDAYKAVMGQAPEWSNWFSFENAIDEIELVCELWRNQTDDVIQFRQRIQELEARQIALPQRLSPEGYHIDEAYMVDDDEGEYLDRDAVIEAIRAADIKVKE